MHHTQELRIRHFRERRERPCLGDDPEAVPGRSHAHLAAHARP